MEKTVSVVLGNGITITGTVADVNAFAQKVGVKFDSSKYHFSQSKGGFIEIATMPSAYLKNVMVRMLEKNYFAGNYVGVSPSIAVFKLLSSSEEFRALMTEYLKKTEVDAKPAF